VIYLSGYDSADDHGHSQERLEMAPGAGDAAARMAKDISALKSTESCMFRDSKRSDYFADEPH
jgi:hypothetical protein